VRIQSFTFAFRLRSNWFERLVFGLDDRLRRAHAVVEYSHDPQCIYRLQRGKAEQDFVLSDGTPVYRGEPLINLHVWNEQFPCMGPDGPTLGWGRQISRALDLSLCELADFLAQRPEFDDVAVIRANLILSTANQARQLLRVMGRHGFEEIPAGATPSFCERLHRSGENILAMLLIMAVNPACAHGNALRWDRAQVFVSRRILEQRHSGSHRRIAAKIAVGAKERPAEIVLQHTASASR